MFAYLCVTAVLFAFASAANVYVMVNGSSKSERTTSGIVLALIDLPLLCWSVVLLAR